jgi:hypothetical protein
MLAHKTQPEIISNEELQRHAQEKLESETKRVKMEVEKTYTEEVFFCHRQNKL